SRRTGVEYLSQNSRNQKLFDSSPFAVTFEIMLDKKRKKGDLIAEGRGQQIQCVQVAQRGKDLKQSPVKLHAVFQLATLGFQTELQQLESLNWIDCVHRLFQRQVHVIHFQQQQRLIDNTQTLAAREPTLSLNALEELPERHNFASFFNLLKFALGSGFWFRHFFRVRMRLGLNAVGAMRFTETHSASSIL